MGPSSEKQIITLDCSGYLQINCVLNFFFYSIYPVITVDIQRNQDRISSALVLERKILILLFLIKVGQKKLLSTGINTKLFCDVTGNREITPNIIDFYLMQTKLLRPFPCSAVSVSDWILN